MNRLLGVMWAGGYLQTWGLACRLKKIPFIGVTLYFFTQWTCGKTIGHNPSKTEWGYGGGDYGYVWCRWCNQIGRIPVSDLSKRFEHARSTIWQFTGCDIARWNARELSESKAKGKAK